MGSAVSPGSAVLAVLLCRDGLPGLLKRCFSLRPSSESNHGLALEHPLSGGESPPITIVVIIEVWRRAGKRTKNHTRYYTVYSRGVATAPVIAVDNSYKNS